MVLATGMALAQNYPTRPVTMIIPFAAGGPTDVLGRVVAQRMSEILGQQVVVENVGGAGGMTGSKRVADAAPDGYTFVLGTVGTHAQGQTLYKKPLYNSATDFTPVALIAEVPIVLTVRKDLPANNFKEFVAYAKANQAQDAVRLGRRRLGDASRLRAAQLRHRDQHHPRALSRHRAGDAGPAGRPHRLPVRDHHHRQAADRRRHREGAGDLATRTARRRCRTCRPALEQGTENLEAYTWNALFLPKGAPGRSWSRSSTTPPSRR